MAVAVTEDERDAREQLLIRVFGIFNDATPDDLYSRGDLFGTDMAAGRIKWARGVLNVLRSFGFIGRAGRSTSIMYYKQRTIPVQECLQLCRDPKTTLDSLERGDATAPSTPPPSLSVVEEPQPDPDDVEPEPPSDFDPPVAEDVDDGDDDDGDGDDVEDGGDDDAPTITHLGVPPDFDPTRALFEIQSGIRQVKARMTVLEHRMMELGVQMDEILREWTGGK